MGGLLIGATLTSYLLLTQLLTTRCTHSSSKYIHIVGWFVLDLPAGKFSDVSGPQSYNVCDILFVFYNPIKQWFVMGLFAVISKSESLAGLRWPRHSCCLNKVCGQFLSCRCSATGALLSWLRCQYIISLSAAGALWLNGTRWAAKFLSRINYCIHCQILLQNGN